MQLTEKHRPTTLASVVGQSATVAAIQRLFARGLESGAFYFVGASGTGKTTLARAIAAQLGVEGMDLFTLAGDECGVDAVHSIRDSFGLSTWGGSAWKVAIIDEAQSITPRAVQAWLPLLESLPKNRLVIFTSTESPCFALKSGPDYTGPLISRCKLFELELDYDAAASHLLTVAQSEGLDGQPKSAYLELLADCRGNIRQALQRIECGEMLKPWTPRKNESVNECWRREHAESMAKAKQDAAQAIVDRFVKVAESPTPLIQAPESELSKEVQEELAYLSKLFPKSKKYVATCSRLAALGYSVQ